jgi:glycosyltransferase involved in cell wall biosynthesis
VPSLLDPSELIAYLHKRVVAHACESDAVADAMVRGGIPRSRCATIYNCVPQAPRVKGNPATLAHWNIPPEAFVVGTVATMRPVKGIDLLLRAAIECGDLTDIHWVLIGPVHDRRITELAQHPALRERVHLLGPQPQAATLAAGFDLFVMPSRTEALCRALLEAMAQRVCPIVSDAGGMKEVVRHGRDGLVVPREDHAALAAAIRKLHGDSSLRANLAASAGERIASEFLPQHMAARAMTLYDRVLGGDLALRRAA